MMETMPIQPMEDTATPAQWRAMYQTGANILVSASAGSGKTYVLINRIIQKVLRGENVDELLIVTFTESAASEMKERLERALFEAINACQEHAQQVHLMKQRQLLSQANISTMHAFCMKVIRRYYYMIDLDPVFTMLTDETELLLLKEKVWSELRETLYELEENVPNQAFYDLTHAFSNDRDDKGLQALIFKLSEFARSHPTPKEFIASLGENYELAEGVALSQMPIFRKTLGVTLPKEVARIEKKVWEMAQIASQLGEEKVQERASEFYDIFQLFKRYVEKEELDFFDLPLSQFVFNRPFASNTKIYKENPELVGRFNALATEVKDYFKKDLVENYFLYPTEKMREVLQKSRDLIAYLSDVCLAFMEKFQQEKLSKGKLDFSDLEHFTLQILTHNENGQLSPSVASVYYRAFFKEVLMDEYQDTNAIQETIAHFVSNGKNRFMVGDVKQSIYRFRQADPTLFIDKYERYSKNDAEGERILLRENFRSRKEVLSFTNFVFNALMDKTLGEIEYDMDAQLVCGNLHFPEDAQMQAEILIYETQTSENEYEEETLDIEGKSHGEIVMVASKIREMIDGAFQIYDKEEKRKRSVQYGDIVLLTPSRKHNEKIAEVFEEFNIPLSMNDGHSFFKTTEMMTMMSLLTIIDNPYQDIPLASVLRSYFVGCDENELVQIRLANSKGSFYEAVKACQSLPKLEKFKTQLEHWRNLARTVSIHELVERIYEESAFPDYVRGLANGRQKQANLYALSRRAKEYDNGTFKGLFQFVRFIEKMREKDHDLAEVVQDISQNQVQIMTIHGSKGLEFPICFVMDMNKRWNADDRKGKYVLDDKLGMGIQYTDPLHATYSITPNNPYKYANFIEKAIKDELKRKALSEEMRKLYVALTRAEQKLFLVGSYKDKETCVKDWLKSERKTGTVLDFEKREKAKSLMEWVGMALSTHTDFIGREDIQTYLAEGTVPEHETEGTHFSLTFMKEQDFVRPKEANIVQNPEIKTSNETISGKILEKVNAKLFFDYPFSQATQTTKYQSVSEIKQLFTDPDEPNFLSVNVEENGALTSNRYLKESLKKPAFLQEMKAEITPAMIGTATHALLAKLDFSNLTANSVNEKLSELIANGTINPEVAENMQLKNIERFVQSDFGQFLSNHAENLKVEQPFSMLMHPSKIFAHYPKEAEDDVLIHGIVDGFVELEDEIILFDYKTDTLALRDKEASIEAIKHRYIGQMNLYKQALALAGGKKVSKAVLVLLATGEVVEV